MADIVIEEMSTDQMPPDAATDTAAVLGQSYKLGAVKGDILLNSYLEAPGITNSIEPGMRAISLQVGDQNMMSGLIMDGDYVDIVFSGPRRPPADTAHAGRMVDVEVMKKTDHT